MAKRKFHEKVETWTIVTVISVLVWLYAEATVLKEDSKVLQVRFSEPTNSYAVNPRSDQNVRVSFKASSGQWQQFQGFTGQPLIIPVDAQPAEDQQEVFVQLAEKLLATELGDLGITDLVAEPQVMAVKLRKIQEMTLEVEVDSGGVQLESLRVDPQTITLRAPADVVEQYRDAKVIARLTAEEVADKQPGQEAVATRVALGFPEGLEPDDSPWITALVREVRIDYTLADNDQSTEKSLPIFINLPVDQQSSYVVELDRQFLSDVRITGPAEVIAGIESGDARFDVWAEIKLNNLSTLPQKSIVYPVIRGESGVYGLTTSPEGIEITISLRENAGP
ncbi:MAG: hypothetical protein AAF333_10045 [Planctomycetota bacterium]